MNTLTTTGSAHGAARDEAHADESGFKLCSRGLALATLVVALAGFAGTAFSAVSSGALFGQPANCMVSH